MNKEKLKRELDTERFKNRELTKNLAMALDCISDMRRLLDCPVVDEDELLPVVSEVIINGPATIVKWEDGKKTVTKCRGGDEFDPLFGIIACILRKLTNNCGHLVSEFEPDIREVAGFIDSIEDIEYMRDVALLWSDVLGVLLMSEDEWMDKLGPADEDADKTASAEKTNAERIASVEADLDKMAREQEVVRQKVRDLIDAGEL